MNESIVGFVMALLGVASAPLVFSSQTGGEQPAQSVVSRSVPTGETVSSYSPFLTLPFRAQDLSRDDAIVNEGWYYSPTEMAIHDKPLHRGVDWPAERGMPVVAAADGYAVRSFQLSETDQIYEGKSVGFSLGEFVEIWHPEQKVYTLYGHLQKASDDIPYVTSRQLNANTWEPVGIYVDSNTLSEKAMKVTRGQIIGYAGDSGIGWGYNDKFDTSTNHVVERNTDAFPSWDETHLHLEVYTRTPDGRLKNDRFDPFGYYDRVTNQRNPYTAFPLPSGTLWMTNESGQPKYFDEQL